MFSFVGIPGKGPLGLMALGNFHKESTWPDFGESVQRRTSLVQLGDSVEEPHWSPTAIYRAVSSSINESVATCPLFSSI